MENPETLATDLISVGVTCFNAEGSIANAVRSAQAQTWPSIEIVAVDDCSTDGSWEILRRMAGEDERMRVIRHPANRGVAAARNTVLHHATGAFVAFFDDDDQSRPERLAKQHRRIVDYERATGSEIVVCYTATERRYPDGTSAYSRCLGMDMTPAPAGMDVARLILLGKPVTGGPGACPTSTQMARRETYRRLASGFDETLRRHEDTDLNLRLAVQGAHFAGLSEPLVVQTVTVAADKTLAAERENLLQLTEKHRTLLDRWGWYDFNRQWHDMKFTLLGSGLRSALPLLPRLFFRSPIKFIQKTAWSLPNRGEYKKYGYHPNRGEHSGRRRTAG